jgi:hypothetical protein
METPKICYLVNYIADLFVGKFFSSFIFSYLAVNTVRIAVIGEFKKYAGRNVLLLSLMQ